MQNKLKFNDLNSWLSWLESLNITRGANIAIQQVTAVAKKLAVLKPSSKVITVGGTNGKGSCVALLESIYRDAGYTVGSFTSPHVLKFNERIKINKNHVKDEEIIAAFERINNARGDIPLVYFQFAFLASLIIFKEQNLDLIILEVGIGGKYDATNIIDTDLAIISSIDLDHCEILGDTRDKIAADKAGIMRSGKSIICGDVNPPPVIFDYAKKIQAKLFIQEKDFYFKRSDDHWDWFGATQSLENLPITTNILLQNASTVLMAVMSFNKIFPVNKKNIINGLEKVAILGRQQLITINGSKILLDVAHNPAAAKLLFDKLHSLKITGKKIALVGFMQEKNIKDIVSYFVSEIDQWVVSSLPSQRSAKAEQLLTALQEAGAKNIQICANLAAALQEALQQAQNPDIIVAFGSFLLASEVLKFMEK